MATENDNQPVKIYTTRLCGFCHAAKHLLTAKGVAFDEIAVDNNLQMREELIAMTGERTVPQIWIGNTHVGGYTDLAALEQQGALDQLLTSIE